ncbi:MAG: formylglycine-generating enzyme family protein [Nannocystis sp.]|nr:formylglycine-generating enzyme family protein [Nannocystis sp.]
MQNDHGAVALVERSLREIPAGVVTIRDAGVTQKLSPTSPRQPFFSRDVAQPRREPRVVTVAAFSLAAVPVTQALWALGRGAPAPPSMTANQPITLVSWLDAVGFCNTLSLLAGLAPAYDIDGDGAVRDDDASGYRLPTEAEWQHACGERPDDLDAVAWYADNAADVVHDVGLKAANGHGLFDMLGNVWEWCEDLFDEAVYGSYRVFRGGGFADRESTLRPGVRRKSHPTYRIDDLGFRIARRG